MILDGHINLKIPGLLDKLTELAEGKEEKFYQRLKKHGGEFDIDLAESTKEEIDFNIWIQMENDDISIKTDFEDDNPIEDNLFLEINSCKEGTLCLTLSIDQAKAIKEILEHYITLWESLRRLQKKKEVIARTKITEEKREIQ